MFLVRMIQLLSRGGPENRVLAAGGQLDAQNVACHSRACVKRLAGQGQMIQNQ